MNFEERLQEKINSKMHSDRRALVIRPKDGQKPKNNFGMVDARLFSGQNNLHAVRDQLSTLWMLKYDFGILPNPLKQKFTSFNKLLTFANKYFDKRGLEITEVIDKHA